jgi:hypothetical protein
VELQDLCSASRSSAGHKRGACCATDTTSL